MNRSIKQILKILAIMIPSGILGAVTMIVMVRVEETQFFVQIVQALETFEQNSWVIHLIILLLGMIVISYTYFKSKSILPELLENEENDELDSTFERTLGLSMVINGIFIVLNFLFFTLAAFEANEIFLRSIGIFLTGFFLSTGFEIASVKLYQRKDPAKRGDPTSTKFARQWFESCDEAEKLMIYQSAHQSFRWTNMGFLFANLVVLLMRLAFGTFGLGTILLLGILWLIHLLGYHLHWMKLKQMK